MIAGRLRRALVRQAAGRTLAIAIAVAVALALCAAPVARAQRAVAPEPALGAFISGVVLDATSGLPVPFAVVSVPALDRSVLSRMNGTFRIDSLPAGTHTLRARQIGFIPATLTVRVLALGGAPEGASGGYTLSLTRLPRILDTIVVTGRAGKCRGRGFQDVEGVPRISWIMS